MTPYTFGRVQRERRHREYVIAVCLYRTSVICTRNLSGQQIGRRRTFQFTYYAQDMRCSNRVILANDVSATFGLLTRVVIITGDRGLIRYVCILLPARISQHVRRRGYFRALGAATRDGRVVVLRLLARGRRARYNVIRRVNGLLLQQYNVRERQCTAI